MQAGDIFPWNDSFNTGIAELDGQHQNLVRLLNMLARNKAHRASMEELEKVFTELADYAAYHFHTEETLWQRHLPGDALESSHKLAHHGFIEKIGALRKDMVPGAEDEVVEEILFFLIRWLATHILESDRYLALVVLALQAGKSLDDAKAQAKEEMLLSMHALTEVLIDIFGNFSRTAMHLLKAEHELRIAAITFDSQDGIAITDENQVILRVNEAFSRITGYPADEVVGKTPAILKSARHGPDFYREMWDSLRSTNHWQGEIWNRRKSGEIYPEWLSITAIRDHTQKVANYVASFSDITKQKKAEETIHNLAFYDPLTKLPNKRLLLDRLYQTALISNRSKEHCAVLLIDLDNFKAVNSTKGHDFGDQLLIVFAERLQSALRPSDTTSRITLSHIGGDAFVVVLDGLGTEMTRAAMLVEAIAQRILACIKQPLAVEDYVHDYTASIGATLFQGTRLSGDDLLKRSEIAMREAKESSGDKVCFFDPAVQASIDNQFQLKQRMKLALKDQYRLHYQAQVNDERRIIGAEILIRWDHPESGLLAPDVFIPIAEESGMIIEIGQWVLEAACRQLKAWELEPKFNHLAVSVNVSSRQFSQPNFVEQVLAVLNETGANPARLKLELTESLLASNLEDIIVKMNLLRKHGVLFSLDDFGTGFSSLAYLRRLPLDQLKIDQSFVKHAFNTQSDAAIVRTIITLGNTLGLAVVAEGVETREQLDFLAANGCHIFQGYLLSRPLPLAEFEQLLDGGRGWTS